jgi:hypothetical protein
MRNQKERATGPFRHPIAPYLTVTSLGLVATTDHAIGLPTGAWHLYSYLISNTKLNDYPKFGVWHDGYYMSINQFTCNMGGRCNWGGRGRSCLRARQDAER